MNDQSVQKVFDSLVDRPEIRDLFFKKMLPDDWDVLCNIQFQIITREPAKRAADEIFRNQIENRLNARGHEIAKMLEGRLRELWETR